MEEEQLQVYNSDSGEENVDIDALSQEMSGQPPQGWIQWYCTLEGNEFLLQIEPEYIKDTFNLHGLLKQINILGALTSSGGGGAPYKKMSKERFRKCIAVIISNHAPNPEDL